MSRFNSLEFNDDSSNDQQRSQPLLKDASYHLNEADAAFQAGDFEKALRCYGKALEFSSGSIEAWTGQVKALIELGEYEEARLWADKAMEVLPDHPELLATKAVALARAGDPKTALLFSDASMQGNGVTPYIWLARGDVLLARNEKRAGFCFDRAFSLSQGDWILRWLASRIHYFYKKFALALKYAQEALNMNAASAVAWLQAGECQLSLGLLVAAESSFTQARQLNPECVRARMALINISNQGWLSKLGMQLRQLFH